MNDIDVVRFLGVFAGNQRSHGVYKPPNKLLTLPSPPTVADVKSHLQGETGLGVVPILDDGTCQWGAIDIDNHGSDGDLPITEIEARVRAAGLPLVVCRSKSGGVHLYLFLKKPQAAQTVRRVLGQWAAQLGIEGVDCVFPKQDVLSAAQFGNWINLPYFDAKVTGRYAVRDGVKLSLGEFIECVELMRAELETELDMAPPCIARLMSSGEKVSQGGRNDALFHIAVYLNKQSPDGLAARLMKMNERLMEPPLSERETAVVAASVGGKDYGYFCDKEPWASLCNRAQCKRSVYGVRAKDNRAVAERSQIAAFPDVERFVKFLGTSPVQWELTIAGTPMVFVTDELMDYNEVRARVFERNHCILPQMKSETWVSIMLPDLLGRLEVEKPRAAGGGVDDLAEHLAEFLSFTDMEMVPNSRIPESFPVVVMTKNTGKAVVWRGQAFEARLKAARVDVPRNRTLWYVMRETCGVQFDRVKVKGALLRVWYLPFDRVMQILKDRDGEIMSMGEQSSSNGQSMDGGEF